MKKSLIEIVSEYVFCLFYPNRCKFCSKITEPFEDVCEDCRDTLPWIDGEICKFCGSLKSDCGCKSRHSNFYDGITAPLYYVDSVKECIHNYKFNDDRLIYKCLADLMSRTCEERYSEVVFDYITYIPMRKNSKRKRGYNQSRLLAKRVAENLDIKFCDDLLVKLYDTKVQRGCSKLERKGNLIGVFDINKKYDVENKTVLIIDDVKTSGATLSECGKMLYLNGAACVYCLTAALVNSRIKEKDEVRE